MFSSKKDGQKRRFAIGPLLLEVFLIILGVMVALAANEWREGRALAQRTDIALENIRLEIERNQKTMQQRLPYHETLRDSLERYLPELRNLSFEQVNEQRLGMHRGLFFLLTYDAAWQTALTSQVLSNVDYETLTILSTIYQVQVSLKTVEERTTRIMTPENLKKDNLFYAFILLRPAIKDIVDLERNLLALYDEALQRLGPS